MDAGPERSCIDWTIFVDLPHVKAKTPTPKEAFGKL